MGNIFLAIIIGSSLCFFVGCHSPGRKEATQVITNKDSLKATNPVSVKKPPTDFFEVMNTRIKNDILKVYRYNNGLIECSLNDLSDTITTGNPYLNWSHIDWMVDGDGNNESIFTPVVHNPISYILNDTLLLINVIDSRGRVNLFLLNRTPNSLKFVRGKSNPICNLSTYVYVDLKHNIIISHDNQYVHGHNKLSDIDNRDESISKDIYSMAGWKIPQHYPKTHSPYFVHRYRIMNRNFIQTDVDTTFFNVFSKIDVNYPDGARQFYTTIASHENWEQDKFTPHD